MFHEAYTKTTFRQLGRIIAPDVKAEVFDLWLSIYNLFDGVLKRLGVGEKHRRRLRFAFTRPPQKLLP